MKKVSDKEKNFENICFQKKFGMEGLIDKYPKFLMKSINFCFNFKTFKKNMIYCCYWGICGVEFIVQIFSNKKASLIFCGMKKSRVLLVFRLRVFTLIMLCSFRFQDRLRIIFFVCPNWTLNMRRGIIYWRILNCTHKKVCAWNGLAQKI